MTDRNIKLPDPKLPGPDHPITIAAAGARVRIRLGDRIIADTQAALVLKEADYPPVYYVPRSDVEMPLLEKTSHATWCPYKGNCSYYSATMGGARAVNAAWSYENPYPAVAAIKDHLAFYPDRVDAIEVGGHAGK